MSKHPTSDLSPRDMACIEYGRRLEDLLAYYYRHRHYIYYENLYEVVDRCRAARERIFRNCGNCALLRGDSVVGHKCEWKESIFDGTESCTCEHYKEPKSHDSERHRAH